MKNSNPLISIVIPTYNQADFLQIALESILAQTYTNWEIIIVNNYSEDDTVEVVKSLSDSRIHLVNFKNNGVIAASRNKGIMLAQGEFVAFLDSDDFWQPEKVMKCVEKLQSGYDLVCHGLVFRWDSGKTKDVVCGVDKLASYDALLYRGNRILTSATVVRRSTLLQVRGFDENPEYATVEDYDLWLRIAKVSKKSGFVNELLGVYRIHQNNASNSGLKHFNAERKLLEDHFKQEAKSGVHFCIKRRKRYALLYYSEAEKFRDNANIKQSFIFSVKAIVNNPFLVEAYLQILQLMGSGSKVFR